MSSLEDRSRDWLANRIRQIGQHHLSHSDLLALMVYVEEAFFFFEVLSPTIEKIRPERILEVGSGIGLLSMLLSEPSRKVTSIDPESSGFGLTSDFREIVKSAWQSEIQGLSFSAHKVDEIVQPNGFDMIICINVLEHTADYRDVVAGCVQLLSKGGVASFVCPNYSIPFEQHFGIPIIFNKEITAKIFRRSISQHVASRDPIGLWQDLSFPTFQEIRNLCLVERWDFAFGGRAFEHYLNRLSDPGFLLRKGALFRLVARLLRIVGRGALHIPLRWRPVIELEITK